jgi:curved DNA-binding protein
VEFKDYYAELGVDRSADEQQIRRAYRRLARRFHPDVSTEPDAERRFREINEAYEVLKDPEKRARYDQYGAHWQQAGGTPGTGPQWRDVHFDFAPQGDGGFGSASGFSAFFDMLFGRGAGQGVQWHRAGGDDSVWQAVPGPDAEARLELTLEEAARGGERSMSLRDPSTGRETTVRFRIPAGVRSGQRIRLAGKGSPGAGGGPAGDLYLLVEVLPHPRFRLDGNHLHTTMTLSPAQAALGTTASVETPDGSVRLRVPAGSSSGRKIRLRGRGYPSPGGPAGDLLVEIRIAVPATLSPRERELYEELDRLATSAAAVA